MQALLLKPDRPAGFARSVRDKNNVVLKRLEFTHGEPQFLDDDELEAVKKDIGTALCYAAIGPNGDPLGKPAKIQKPFDWAAFEAAKAEAEKPREEAESIVSGPDGDPAQNGEAKPRRTYRR
jgi:hypothetical protein